MSKKTTQCECVTERTIVSVCFCINEQKPEACIKCFMCSNREYFVCAVCICDVSIVTTLNIIKKEQ